MTRQARLPASTELLPDERTSLPSPHTLCLGQRPTHTSSALNATRTLDSLRSNTSRSASIRPRSAISWRVFPLRRGFALRGPRGFKRSAPRAPSSTSQLPRRALDLRHGPRCCLPFGNCHSPTGLPSLRGHPSGTAITWGTLRLKSASAEVLGVPEDCGPIRPLASKRHWQREAKAQTLRRTRRLVREGIRLRALPATDSDCRCSVHHMTWRPPSPPKPIASWGFGARPVKNQSSTGSHRHRSRHRSHHRTPSWRHQRAIPGRKTPLVFVGIFSTGSLDRFARTLRTPQCRARCSLLGRACSQRCPC